MRRQRNFYLAVVFGALAAGCGGGERTVPQATPAEDQAYDAGDYIIHYNAISTDEVPAEVAKSVGIVRARNRAMLTVSIVEEDSGESREGDINVRAANLSGQLKNISMRKVEQGASIYYLGEVSVAHQETLIFDIEVTPEGETTSSEIRYKRQFYTD